jgi:hypothetical protein
MNDRLHDEELGALLRELEVPDHSPTFFEDLRTQLAAEAPASPAPGLDARGRLDESHQATPTSGGGRRRLAWKRHSLRLATVAAAAAVIAVAVGVGLGGPGSNPVAPRSASAAEVTQRVQEALADVRTLRGELLFRLADRADDPTAISEVRYSFVTDDTGNFRLRGLTRREDLGYDAALGVERGYSFDPEGNSFGGERRGVALGYPDQGPANWVLEREVAATVRALVTTADSAVDEVRYDGRDAWELDTPVRANALSEMSGDRQQITVDQRTGLPVRIVETRQGRLVKELRLEKLVVDSDVSAADYTVTAPPGVEMTVTDIGWRRVTAAEAAARAGYAPLLPTDVPDGFQLAQVVYGDQTGPTGVEGSNPQTRRAVGALYRRGLDVLLVTTRLRDVEGGVPADARQRCGRACLAGSQWTDPLASGEGFQDDPEELVLKGGALDAAPAQLLVDPRTTPHLWALTPTLVVTVSGDLSRAELLSVAQSLTPQP